jgi:FxLD family lantipeptide
METNTAEIANPFALDVEIVIDVRPGELAEACTTNDGCASTCASACASRS